MESLINNLYFLHCSCQFDYIELRDGGTTNSRSLGRFCGRIPPGTVKSTGNVMFARFRTDNSVPKIGFKAQYKIGKVIFLYSKT
jgi:hypothetical protein